MLECECEPVATRVTPSVGSRVVEEKNAAPRLSARYARPCVTPPWRRARRARSLALAHVVDVEDRRHTVRRCARHRVCPVAAYCTGRAAKPYNLAFSCGVLHASGEG
eukprot:5435592-Prymnesium_polylepis.1